MKFCHAVLMLPLFAIVITGCVPSNSNTNDRTGLTIYTSVYPIQYAVERIGGNAVHAETIYPPGVDAHTYEPSARKMTTIAEGDAFIYLGAGMEGFAETAAAALETQDVRLIEIGTNEELFHRATVEDQSHNHAGEHDGHSHHGPNPHIWLDPIRMLDMAGIIKEKLIAMQPENKEQFIKNFKALKDDLQTLDHVFHDILQAKENKKILVSHAAYDYWEERYGIEQIAISGLASNDEPSQKELISIIDQAKKYDMDYILFEQNSSDRISEIIQEHIGAKGLAIHNLSVLTEADINEGDDYMSLMKQNLDVLNQATD
ncbi:adhesin [Lentibacillus lipolyticus]|nr:adhesin [Lentibacillus lipolyticus]